MLVGADLVSARRAIRANSPRLAENHRKPPPLAREGGIRKCFGKAPLSTRGDVPQGQGEYDGIEATLRAEKHSQIQNT